MFPDREFIMRSQGQVRFIKISTRFQLLAAALTGSLLLIWLTTMIAMSAMSYFAERDRLALLDREAKVETAESRVSRYRDDIDAVSADLSRRQAFIESMVEDHIGDLPDAEAATSKASHSRNEAERTIRKVSAAIPEATGLARIEAQQLAFVERLTRYADRRAESAANAIRKLGLSPKALLASVNRQTGQGGPFITLANGNDALDPRFERLGLSLARMDGLQRSLAGIPQVHPAKAEFISSRFGYRTDPINGHAAFHAGLDFAGPMGAPVYAAANGKISFAGQRRGYGNCVEVDHGNGLTTRYAHMSRFRVAMGQTVKAGEVIGAIGSTGRSTGPHLHFEVRVHGTPVNPRPFLEKSLNVQQETRSGT